MNGKRTQPPENAILTVDGIAIMMTCTNQIFCQRLVDGLEAVPELSKAGVRWDRTFTTTPQVEQKVEHLLHRQKCIRMAHREDFQDE